MIAGLTYIPHFLNAIEQETLLDAIDGQPWLSDLKRRVQHYGYKYDYRARKIVPEMYLGGLPEFLVPVAARLAMAGYFDTIPEQVIVNEYVAGQGIAPHVDCEPCFGNTIASISLGSGAEMNFSAVDGTQKEVIYLERGSLLVMQNAARYEWKHGIAARKSDMVNGQRLWRMRRVSVTLRTIISA